MRLARRLLLVLLLVAATAAGGLWLWRLSLVDRLIAAELARRGFPDAEVAVVELELGRAVLAPVRLGPDLAAARVVATYDPAGIAAGALDGLVIEGLAVDLDKPGEGALGRLGALARPAGGTQPDGAQTAGAAAAAALPHIRLIDATVRATTPAGPVRLGLDASFAPQPDGPARLEADLRLESDHGRLSGTAAGTVAPAGPAASLILDIVGERLALGAAAVESVTVAARLDVGGAGAPELAADLVLAGVSLGEARFAVVRADVRSFGAAVEATVHLPPPDGEAGMQLTLRRAADGALDARLFGDLARDPRLFAIAGLPPPAGGSLAVFAEASVPAGAPLPPAAGPQALAGWMAGNGAALHLDVDAADLALPGLFGAATVTLAAELPGPDGAAVLLADGARVQVRDTAPALLAALPGALRPLAGGTADLTLAPGARLAPSDGGWRIDARIEAGLRRDDERLGLAGDLAARLPADAPATAATVRLSGLRLDAALSDLPALAATGSASWSGTAGSVAADLQLPDLALAADGVRLDVTPGDDALDATLTIAALRSTATPPAFPPAELAATARLRGGTVAFDGTAQALAGRLAATFAGRHDAGTGTGSATVTVPPVALGPGGVARADLLPALAGATAAGRVGGAADLAWGPDGLDGSGRVGLAGVDLALGELSVAGLAGDIAFASLLPPTTRPEQRLVADRAVLGVPFDAPLLVFALEAGPDGPRLRITAAELGFAGGRLRVQDVALDPADPELAATLELEGLELEQLAALAGVDGLSATGRIGGRLPLQLDGDRIAVAGGRLAAASEGRIRFDGAAAEQLAGQDARLALALRALRDFRYSLLALEIDKTADGAATLVARLEGASPEVEDGRPIHFNVNLDATRNVERLLRELLAGYRLSLGMLRDIVR